MKKISENPISKKKYFIPDKIDDKANIDSFLSNHVDKKVIVV